MLGRSHVSTAIKSSDHNQNKFHICCTCTLQASTAPRNCFKCANYCHVSDYTSAINFKARNSGITDHMHCMHVWSDMLYTTVMAHICHEHHRYLDEIINDCYYHTVVSRLNSVLWRHSQIVDLRQHTLNFLQLASFNQGMQVCYDIWFFNLGRLLVAVWAAQQCENRLQLG